MIEKIEHFENLIVEEIYPNQRIIESDYIFWTKKQMKKFNLNFV